MKTVFKKATVLMTCVCMMLTVMTIVSPSEVSAATVYKNYTAAKASVAMPKAATKVKVTPQAGALKVTFTKGKYTNRLAVLYKKSTATKWNVKTVKCSASKSNYTVTIGSLKENAKYDIKIRSRNVKTRSYKKSGKTVKKEFTKTIKTKTYTATTKYYTPSALKELTAAVDGQNVTLKWNKSNHATKYIVKVGTKSYTVTGTSKKLTLSYGTSYTASVTPYNNTKAGAVKKVSFKTDVKPAEPKPPVDPKPNPPVNPEPEPVNPDIKAEMRTSLTYNGTTIHLGEIWSDEINGKLNGGAAAAPVANRTYVDVYTYDTVDYDNFLMVYVFTDYEDEKEKIAGWLVRSDAAMNIDETEEISNYVKLADKFTSVLMQNDTFWSGDALENSGGLNTIEKQRAEELIAEQSTNAIRVAYGKSILKHHEDLYNEEFGSKNWAKALAANNITNNGHDRTNVFKDDPIANSEEYKGVKLYQINGTYNLKKHGQNLEYGANCGEMAITDLCTDHHRVTLLSDEFNYTSVAVVYDRNYIAEHAWVQDFWEIEE